MKTRTKNRLIPAGEKSPRIGGLELCSEEHLVRPCTLLLIFGVEETATELIDLPVELEHERVLAPDLLLRMSALIDELAAGPQD